LYKYFDKLLQRDGITAYKVAKATGITNSTFSEWKKGTYTPKVDKLQKIADYFGVPLEYLLTGKEAGNG
jgi:transcriptional regulator with XRE-family HTH domain